MQDNTIQINIDVDQFVNRLKMEDKIRLVRKLEEQTLETRIDELFKKIDKRYKKNPISQQEINKIVKEVRKEMYG